MFWERGRVKVGGFCLDGEMSIFEGWYEGFCGGGEIEIGEGRFSGVRFWRW